MDIVEKKYSKTKITHQKLITERTSKAQFAKIGKSRKPVRLLLALKMTLCP